MASEDGSVLIDVKLKTDQLEKELKEVSAKLGGLEKNTLQMSKGFGKASDAVKALTGGFDVAKLGAVGLGVAGAMAVKKLIDSLNECAAAYRVQETAERALAQAARNNPYMDGHSVSELRQYARELEKTTNYTDESILQMMTMLSASGRTKEQIQRIVATSIDIASSGTMSLESAIKNLNRTFGGLSGELGEIEPQIKSLTQEELANGKAVEVMAGKYKGMSREVKDVNVQLKNAFQTLKESIGAGWDKLFEKPKEALKSYLDKVNDENKRRKDLDDAVAAQKAGKSTEAQKLLLVESYKKAQDYWMYYRENYGDIIEGVDETATERVEKATKELEVLSRQLDAINRTRNASNAQAKKQAEEDKKNDLANYLKQAETNKSEAFKKLEKEAALKGETVTAQKKLNVLYEQYTKLIGESDGRVGEDGATAKRWLAEIRDLQKRNVLEQIEAQRKEALATIKMEAEARDRAGIEADKKEENRLSDKTKELEAYMTSYVAVTAQSGGLFTKDSKEAQELLEKIKEIGGEVVNLDLENDIKEKFEKAIKDTKPKQKDSEILTERLKDLEHLKNEAIRLVGEECDEAYRIRREYATAESELAGQIEKAKQIEKEDDLNREKEIFDKRLSLFTDFLDRYMQASQAISSLVRANLEAESQLEMANLEEQYAKGAVSEQEYYDKKNDIKRKAAQEEYKIKMWEWGNSIVSASVSMAQGIINAMTIKPTWLGITMASLVGAMGAAQIALMTANKPTPPAFATGGIVGGTSYTGDRVRARLNSGEMILNAGQQRNLFNAINEGRLGGSLNIKIYNSASNDVSAAPRMTPEGLEVLIRRTVSRDMESGRMDSSYKRMYGGLDGNRLTT